MYLIPQGQAVTVEVKVLPADIEQIFINQSVDMKFSSFSQRTTPDLLGTVTTVSADTFIEERSGVQFYLLEIAIQEGETKKLPEGAVLIPGMPVDVFIETQSRTPLEYLIQPFQDSIARAFRES
jgi:HlyD family secretion protein